MQAKQSSTAATAPRPAQDATPCAATACTQAADQSVAVMRSAADRYCGAQDQAKWQMQANQSPAVRQLMTLKKRAASSALSGPVRQNVEDYAGETVGVEQELVSDMKVKLPKKERGQFGHVQIKGARGRRIANVTSDMGDEVNGYTIELRTDPYVAANEGDKKLAREAMLFLLDELKAAAMTEDGKLENKKEKVIGEGDGEVTLQLRSLNAKSYRITSPTDGAGNFSNQVTVGVKTSDFLRAVAGEKTGGESDEIVKAANWLDPAIQWPETPQQADGGARDAEVSAKTKGAFIALASAIRFAEGLFKTIAETPITDPKNKNLWGALPRNALSKWLNVLDDAERGSVLEKLRLIGADRDDTDPMVQARNYVLSGGGQEGGEFAGHPIPEFTIEREQGTAFEYRDAPPRLGTHLIGDQIDPTEAPRGIQLDDDARRRITAMRGRSGSESESESDWDE